MNTIAGCYRRDAMNKIFVKIARKIIALTVYKRIRMNRLSVRRMIINSKLADSKSFDETVCLIAELRRVNRKRFYYFIQTIEEYDL